MKTKDTNDIGRLMAKIIYMLIRENDGHGSAFAHPTIFRHLQGDLRVAVCVCRNRYNIHHNPVKGAYISNLMIGNWVIHKGDSLC